MTDGPQERAAAVYPRAAVAHERPESTDAGLKMLRDGGNAVDAAVAVAFAACVVMPAWTTIAGSGFMLVRQPDGRPTSVEFPPRAPLAASPDMYELEPTDGRTSMIGVSAVEGDANVRGGRAVGVPAAVAGLCEAHARFGRLPLGRVMQPAIDLARDGFCNYPELQSHTLDVLPDLRLFAAREVFGTLLTADGLPWARKDAGGEAIRIRQRKLASVLEAIAEHGPDGFYRGPVAEAIVAEVARYGGLLSERDLAEARALVTEPLSARVGKATVWSPTSPNGGWTELQLLGLLDRLDGVFSPERPFDLGTFIEASRRCFSDRYHFLADPEQVEVPLDVLLGDAYLDQLAEEVTECAASGGRQAHPEAPPWAHYASRIPESFARIRPDLTPTPWSASPGTAAGLGDSFETTHLSTVDEDGMAVSCTLTAAYTFGSRIVASGVVLDGAMVWFNAMPGAANSIAPRKRPLVNMGPLLIERPDDTMLAIGAPGGRRVVSAVAEVTAHWLRGDSLDEAISRPRVDASGNEVLVSARADPKAVDELRRVGYAVRTVEDRDRFCGELARPGGVALTAAGDREAAVQPFISGSVRGF
jgi:gamma-glutamyltranspeptidase / glutathione hydrolase